MLVSPARPLFAAALVASALFGAIGPAMAEGQPTYLPLK
jgi:hypothetical protein